MFVGKSGGLQLTGFRCSCIFCSGSSAKHGGMVCKKNNATKREIQQNLRLKFFNLLLFYHNALANWSSFTTAGFFLFTFSYHQKKQIQSRRKPPTAYQGSKPPRFAQGAKFSCPKNVGRLWRHPDISPAENKVWHRKNVADFAARERRENILR